MSALKKTTRPDPTQKKRPRPGKGLLWKLPALFVTLALFAGLLVFGYRHYIAPKVVYDPLWTQSLQQPNRTTTVSFSNGQTLSQTFCHDELLSCVNFGFSYSEPVPADSGYYEVSLYDATTEQLLDTMVCNIPAGYDTIQHGFAFTGNQYAPEGLYRVTVTPHGFPEELEIRLIAMTKADPDFCAEGGILDGEELPFTSLFSSGTIHARMATFYWIFAAGTLLVVLFVFLLFAFTRLPVHWKFALAALALGCLACIVMPPFNSHDEDRHFGTAYYAVQKLFTPELSDDVSTYLHGTRYVAGTNYEVYRLPGRVEDEQIEYTSVFYDLESYYTYFDQFSLRFGVPNDSDGKIDVLIFDEDPPISYFASAFGILLGRLLGVSADLLLIFARFGSLFFYILLCAFGIRLAPKGKYLLASCALLPSAVLITCTAANDLLHCGTGILLAGAAFALADRERRISFAVVFALLLSTVAMLISGQFQQLPLILFVVFLLLRRRFPDWKPRRVHYLTAAALIAVAALAWFLLVRSGVLHTAADQDLNQHMTLTYVLCHPLRAAWMLLCTFFLRPELYLQQLLGTQLGWNNINVGGFALTLLAVLMLFQGIYSAAELKFPTAMRVGSLICAAAIILLAFCVGFQWTSALYFSRNQTLWGVQGRYFLAMLPLALAALPQHAPKKDGTVQNALCLAVCLAAAYVFVLTMFFGLAL